MQKGLKLTGQMRALAIALGGAIVTSVIAMFIPVSVFEAITGSTGISELIPATGAPLGDTAKAMIAFVFGATAFAVLAAYLLRKPGKSDLAKAVKTNTVVPETMAAETVAANGSDAVQKPSLLDQMRAKLAAYMESRRQAKAEAVTELSDLPKLRTGDAHPDAPPRRPISAHRDFGEIFDEPAASVENVDDAVEPLSVAATAVEEYPVSSTSAFTAPVADETKTVAESAAASTDIVDDATVTAMVERLEAALEQRKDQLAKLEAVATAELAEPVVVEAPHIKAEIVEDLPAAPRPVILEAVPSDPVKEVEKDDMDAALRSALETLHRMNVRTR